MSSDIMNSMKISAQGMRAQGTRIRVATENVANADTPGYAPRDLKAFKFTAQLQSQQLGVSMQPAQTSAGHMPGGGVRRSGASAGAFKTVKGVDTETTLDELRARVRRTLDYVASFAPAQIDGSETREIVVPTRTSEMRFSGSVFARSIVSTGCARMPKSSVAAMPMRASP